MQCQSTSALPEPLPTTDLTSLLSNKTQLAHRFKHRSGALQQLMAVDRTATQQQLLQCAAAFYRTQKDTLGPVASCGWCSQAASEPVMIESKISHRRNLSATCTPGSRRGDHVRPDACVPRILWRRLGVARQLAEVAPWPLLYAENYPGVATGLKQCLAGI